MKFEFLKNIFDGSKRIPKTDITKRFELIGRVGQGSMSRVWRSRDTQTGKIVALKVLDKEKTKRFEARFAPELKKPTEGEIAVTLKHPNIVTTYEWGITQEREQFLVMEFIDGLGLSYLVDVQNDVMQKHRLSFMIQLGEALRYLHEENWIHRDICPRNVLVTDGDLQIKLIDFGLVVPNTTPFQAPGNRTGTANYMAPELIKRQRTDQRIDIFSYAVTCYEMYTRRFPWKAAESLDAVLQHMNTRPHDIREGVPGIDEQVATAIMKGLENSPSDRWQSLDPMIYQFREAQERLFPAKSKTGGPARQAGAPRPATSSGSSAKPTGSTPGITLAEEGIALAADQPEDLRYKGRKAAGATPGISLADEGITLADDQPPDARKERSARSKAPTPASGHAEERIALTKDQPDLQEKRTTKARTPTPAITVAEEGITLADDQPQSVQKPPVKSAKSTPGIALAADATPPAEESGPQKVPG